jgi:hypothetical protein
MPLPSVEKFGAKRCIAKNRKTGLQCKNPASWGCRTCRYHGARKSKNSASGQAHYRYKSGEGTKEAKAEHKCASTLLLTLRDIGDSIDMFNGSHTRGRKPDTYIKYDMNDPEQVIQAITKILPLSSDENI